MYASHTNLFSLFLISSPPREEGSEFRTVHTIRQGALSTGVPSASWRMFSHSEFSRGLSKSSVSAVRLFMKTDVPAGSYAAGLVFTVFLYQGSLRTLLSSEDRASRFRIPRRGESWRGIPSIQRYSLAAP